MYNNTGVDGTSNPSVPGVDGTTNPSVPGVDGTTNPSVPGVDGTTNPSVPGVDGTTNPSVPGVDGTTNPSVPGIDGTTNPSVPVDGAATSVPTKIAKSNITNTAIVSNTSSSMSVGAIAGVVIATLLLLVALTVLAVLIILRWGKILNAITTQTDTPPSPTILIDYHSSINTKPNSCYSYTSSTATNRVSVGPSTPSETDEPIYDEIPTRPDPMNDDCTYSYAYNYYVHTPKDCSSSASDGVTTSDRSEETSDDSTPDQPRTELEQTVVVYI